MFWRKFSQAQRSFWFVLAGVVLLALAVAWGVRRGSPGDAILALLFAALGGALAWGLRGGLGTSGVQDSLQKRLRELTTLNRVSQALRSSLGLEDLLPVLQEQVTQVLGVRNFYVALLDQQTNELWYPLAVKGGVRQSWPRRPLEERLTDRVIRESRVIMLTPARQQGANSIGMPAGESTPKSWLGVPLVTPERTIGCLAVYDLAEGVEFTRFDVDLLITLSGQVSVAIDNALLYAQARLRAHRLETLNRSAALIAASLNLDDVLAEVCRAVEKVSDGQACAIYLLDGEGERVRLAHSTGLSPAFIQANAAYRIEDGRAACARSGEVVVTSDARADDWPVEAVDAFEEAGFTACVDLPLTPPGGVTGFLRVYYAHGRSVPSDEIRLLQTLATQAAMSVENARLYARTDARLAERLQQLNALINSVAEGILMLGPDGNIRLVNRVITQMLDLSAEQLNDVHLSALSPQALARLGFSVGEVDELLERLSSGANVGDLAAPQQVKTESPPRVFVRSLYPVYEGERASGWMIVWRDITEEYNINRERAMFAEALVHDLRSPISAVLGSIDLVEEVLRAEDLKESDVVFRSLLVVRRSARRVLRLVRSMLDMARMEAGRAELDRAVTDLRELIEEVAQDASLLAREYGLEVVLDIGDDLPPLWIDREKIARVLFNLLDNALKFSSDGSQISVRARLAGEAVEVSVRDQGPGVPAELRAAIFERFTRLSTQSGRWRGAGLGLSFCKLAVEAHGGEIWVEDPADGGPGSVFTFRLPVAPLEVSSQ